MMLSVIIPAWGEVPFLQRAIRSVEESGFRDVEIIVCQPPASGGAGAARNEGLKKAKGRYIHFLDADDVVCKGAYQKFVEIAERERLDVIRGNAHTIDFATNREIFGRGLYMHNNVFGPICQRAIQAREAPIAVARLTVVPWAGLIRRSFIEEKRLSFRDSVCGNDVVFFIESIIKAESIRLLKEPIVKHWVNRRNSLVGRRHIYYWCDFDNYRTLERMLCDSPKRLKLAILNSQLSGLAMRLIGYERHGYMTHEMRANAVRFLNQLDLSAWHHPERRSWFLSLRNLFGYDVFPYLQTAHGGIVWRVLEKVVNDSHMLLGVS